MMMTRIALPNLSTVLGTADFGERTACRADRISVWSVLGETTRKGSEVPMLFKELDVAQKVVHVRSWRR